MRRAALWLLMTGAAWGQTPATGSITGKTVDESALFVPSPSVGLFAASGTFAGMNKTGDKAGVFRMAGIPAGSYIFLAKVRGLREIVRPVRVEAGQETDLGAVLLPMGSCDDPGAACAGAKRDKAAVPVLSVCDALLRRDQYFSQQVILVGRLSETKRETTLSAECGFSLSTGAFAWPNSIAVADAAGARLPALPAGFTWDEKALGAARKALAGTAATGKLAAIFGRFESPAGLVKLDCPARKLNCSHGAAALSVPPALLIQDAVRTSRYLD